MGAIRWGRGEAELAYTVTWGAVRVAQMRPTAWEPAVSGRGVADTVGTTGVTCRDTRARPALRGGAADGVWGVAELVSNIGPIRERRVALPRGYGVAALGRGVVAVAAGRLATGVAGAACTRPTQAGRDAGPERAAGASRPVGRDELVGAEGGGTRTAVGGCEEAWRAFSLGIRLDVAVGAAARGGQVVEVVGAGATASTTTDSSSEEIVPASSTMSVSAGVAARATGGARGARAW